MDKNCIFCNQELKYKFSRRAEYTGLSYDIYRCLSCRHWQIWPLPDPKELVLLYHDKYFEKRTQRGYDNYTSDVVKASILNTLEKNLRQLGFYYWEKKLKALNGPKRVLDIGCASGYFLEYLESRGWVTEGIDISSSMARMAKKKGLNVRVGDFLKINYPSNKYDLITLWATLEHFAEIEKIIYKCHRILKPEGHLYLSTCHLGLWARIRGVSWRFLNVPEHIWYFSKRLLKTLGTKNGFILVKEFTYGSGFTAKQDAWVVYLILKKLADQSAKRLGSGDMIVCDFAKILSPGVKKLPSPALLEAF